MRTTRQRRLRRERWAAQAAPAPAASPVPAPVHPGLTMRLKALAAELPALWRPAHD